MRRSPSETHLEESRQLVVARIWPDGVGQCGGVDDRLTLGEGELCAVGSGVGRSLFVLPPVRVNDGSGDRLETLADATDALDERDVDNL